MAGPGSRRRSGGLLLTVAPWMGLAAVTALWIQDRQRPRPGLSRDDLGAPAHFDASEPHRGRMAEAPTDIPAPGWRDVLWRTWLEVGQDRLPSVAGGVTFYALLAIFPAIGVFVSLYGLFADVGEVNRQLNQIAAFVPRDILGLLGEQMVRLASERDSKLSVAFLVSLLLSVWSANAGIAALFDGLNIAYDETEKRNFFLRRVITYAFTFGALVFVTAVTGVLVAIPVVLKRIGYSDESLLIPFRWLALLGLAIAAFAILYRFGPSRTQARWRWVRWGAVAAAVAWIGGSLGFSFYVNNIGHFSATYGPLAAMVGFMVWIWFSVMVLLLGAELNAELEHQTACDSTVGAPKPMGVRGAAMADTVGLKSQGFRTLWAGLPKAQPPARH